MSARNLAKKIGEERRPIAEARDIFAGAEEL